MFTSADLTDDELDLICQEYPMIFGNEALGKRVSEELAQIWREQSRDPTTLSPHLDTYREACRRVIGRTTEIVGLDNK